MDAGTRVPLAPTVDVVADVGVVLAAARVGGSYVRIWERGSEVTMCGGARRECNSHESGKEIRGACRICTAV